MPSSAPPRWARPSSASCSTAVVKPAPRMACGAEGGRENLAVGWNCAPPEIARRAHRARLVVAAAQLVEVRDERLPLVVAVLVVGERLLQRGARARVAPRRVGGEELVLHPLELLDRRRRVGHDRGGAVAARQLKVERRPAEGGVERRGALEVWW